MDLTMAMLEELGSGQQSHLVSRHLIGRSRSCHLCIGRPSISGVHAEILWDGDNWKLQDLGSRNGTFVDGYKVPAGEQQVLSLGAEIVFGTKRDRYRFTDDSPPRLMAKPDHGEPCIADEDMILCLPSRNLPELMIFRDGQSDWVAERADGTRVISDQDSVLAGGRSWRVSLPGLQSPTRDAEKLPSWTFHDYGIRFEVSRDGEHVGIELLAGETVQTLESRAHVQLLLTLARTRQEDSHYAHLRESDHGWVHREDLLTMLGIDSQLLNLWVYRARRQLARAGVEGAANIVERRAGTHQMRIGLRTLHILES